MTMTDDTSNRAVEAFIDQLLVHRADEASMPIQSLEDVGARIFPYRGRVWLALPSPAGVLVYGLTSGAALDAAYTMIDAACEANPRENN